MSIWDELLGCFLLEIIRFCFTILFLSFFSASCSGLDSKGSASKTCPIF